MPIPVPLGVRICNVSETDQVRFSTWVTNAVEDLSFRSAVPGGFASATIKLHRPSVVTGPTGFLFGAEQGNFERLAALFNRVQVVDLRSAEIVWEGRIEDPRRSTEDDSWELGCLGSMVVASDIQRPMFYADADVNSWIARTVDWFDASTDADRQTIEIRWAGDFVFDLGTLYQAITWQRAQECDVEVGRYDISFYGTAPASRADGAGTAVNLWVAVDDASAGAEIDAVNHTENVRHTRIIGLIDALNFNPFFDTNIDGWTPLNVTIAHSTAVVHPDGDGSLRITPDGVSASGGAGSNVTMVNTVKAGQTYTASMQANLSAGTVTAHVLVNWHDAAGAFLSSSLSAGTALVAGVWTNVSATFSAPASAARASVWAWHSGTPTAGEVWYAWRVRLQAVNNHFATVGGLGGTAVSLLDIELGKGSGTATPYITRPDTTVTRLTAPHVYAERVDRRGAALQDPTDYPNDYVTLPQVVEDVVGRFLAVPSTLHQVRPDDAFIDTTSTARFTHLTYYDGATAADILGDMMSADTRCYWALWESNLRTSSGDWPDFGFRFEWATWPAGPGYFASSIDGLEEQPSAENVFNRVYYRYTSDGSDVARPAGTRYTIVTDDLTVPALARPLFQRGVTVIREEPTSFATAEAEAPQVLAGYRKVGNRGSITIRRPIRFYDPGGTSWTGAGRMVDPWEIRPGKLIRITDTMPSGRIDDFSYGAAAPPAEHDGVVWRVVATEYSSADNSCRLELDQPTEWQVATQIKAVDSGPAPVIKRG